MSLSFDDFSCGWNSGVAQKLTWFMDLTSLNFYFAFIFFLVYVRKTPSDNLNDVIQFMREYDREGAEMCNR
jgi:hypothetical protein